MRTLKIPTIGVLILASVCATANLTSAKDDDFGAVVKMIEQFYHVKHQGIPFLAKAGMKAATTAARIKGGTARRLAEAGSIKLAVFENQEFNSTGRLTEFRNSMNAALVGSWSPLVQTLSATDGTQTYIFLRDASDKYHVLVVTIEPHDATVVQVTLSPRNLALLMQDPDDMGRAITEDATTVDPD
jgi:hypothetical protein